MCSCKVNWGGGGGGCFGKGAVERWGFLKNQSETRNVASSQGRPNHECNTIQDGGENRGRTSVMFSVFADKLSLIWYYFVSSTSPALEVNFLRNLCQVLCRKDRYIS